MNHFKNMIVNNYISKSLVLFQAILNRLSQHGIQFQHIKSSKHNCNICKSVFSNKQDLRAHLKKHRGKADFNCF